MGCLQSCLSFLERNVTVEVKPPATREENQQPLQKPETLSNGPRLNKITQHNVYKHN